MKRNRSILNWLFLLMMTVGMTSCEELLEAVFGPDDRPTQSGSSTTPDIQIDNATLTLSVGQTASRPATAKSADIQLTYASSTPAGESRGQVIDLFPKDENRETEVSGFRFFFVSNTLCGDK